MSADNQLDTTDRVLQRFERLRFFKEGGQFVSGLPPYTVTRSVRLPEGVSGPFFFFVRTDATNVIDEFAFELNNSNFDAQPTTVNLTPPPDLEVVSVNLPATGQAGHGFTFTYTGTNAGALRTPNSSWTDEFYLSSDNQLGAGDTLLSSRFIAFPDLRSLGFLPDSKWMAFTVAPSQ